MHKDTGGTTSFSDCFLPLVVLPREASQLMAKTVGQLNVWTGADLEDPQGGEFSIRRVHCSEDLPHNRHITSLAAEIAKLQKDVGTEAEVIIDSGNVPELLNPAAAKTKADALRAIVFDAILTTLLLQ